MLVHVIQELSSGNLAMVDWSHVLQANISYWPGDSLVLAQRVNTDLGTNVSQAFDNFVKSGQVWAMFIGIVIGYLVRSFTTYG